VAQAETAASAPTLTERLETATLTAQEGTSQHSVGRGNGQK